MSTFNSKDKRFLKAIGAAEPEAKAAPVQGEFAWGQEIFDAKDMQRRAEQLKREGRMPSLEYILDAVKRVQRQMEAEK
jgi:hypothetical protein